MLQVDINQQVQLPGCIAEQALSGWARLALHGASQLRNKDRAEVSVVIVDESTISELNQRYRDKPGATNVLAFPAESSTPDGCLLLGDIILCAPVIEREAREQGKQSDAHWAHLVVHGMLHLLGYDHVADADAKDMENKEISLLASIGVPNPYQPENLAGTP